MIQIDMKMPENCCDCPFIGYDDAGNLYCHAMTKYGVLISTVDPQKRRSKYCPLKEVKEGEQENGC